MALKEVTSTSVLARRAHCFFVHPAHIEATQEYKNGSTNSAQPTGTGLLTKLHLKSDNNLKIMTQKKANSKTYLKILSIFGLCQHRRPREELKIWHL